LNVCSPPSQSFEHELGFCHSSTWQSTKYSREPSSSSTSSSPWQVSQPLRAPPGLGAVETVTPSTNKVTLARDARPLPITSLRVESVSQLSGDINQLWVAPITEHALEPGSLDQRCSGLNTNTFPTPLRLRHGMLDLRVVLRPIYGTPTIPVSLCPLPISPSVMTPVAVIEDRQSLFLAYPHAEHGNLRECLLRRCSSMQMNKVVGCPVDGSRIARIVHQVILGIEALLQRGDSPKDVVSCISPTSIFIDASESVKVRAPVHSARAPSRQKLFFRARWISPEEAAGQAVDHTNVWSVICYRLGLLIYCLGFKVGTNGNYKIPFVDEEHPVSVNLEGFGLTGLLRNILEDCLRLTPVELPSRSVLLAVLHALGAGGNQGHQ